MSRKTLNELRHEVRTSLNHISGFTEILIEDARELGDLDLVPQFERIFNETERLRELVSFYMNPETCNLAAYRESEVRRRLHEPLLRIRRLGEEIAETCRSQGRPFFREDIENIERAAKRIAKAIDTDYSALCDELSRHAVASTAPGRSGLRGDPPLVRAVGRDMGSGRILLVDEDASSAGRLYRHLSRQGYTVVVVEDAQHTLDRLSTEYFDVVILDVLMPGGEGFGVLEAVAASDSLRHIPVIVISELTEMDSVATCIERGAEDYFPRSFDPILLRARIQASIEKKRLRDKEKLYMQALMESQRALLGELADAAQYVRNLLPPPLTGPIRTDWVFIPSAQLGGDCFGYHWIDDGHLGLYLLDVSGHGIGAALLSVSVMNLLRTEGLPAVDFRDPASVLNSLNRRFRMEEQNNMYFTIWYGVYDANDRALRYASAGSPPAILSPGTQDGAPALKELGTGGLVIGVDDSTAYHTEEQHISAHSRLFLFSDGAYEIRRNDGDVLQFQEFRNIFRRLPTGDGSHVQQVYERIREKTGTETFDDDFSLLEVMFENSG
jgi:sigma-B regulation protein RsbU (phosphoserine phosphatase)